MQEYEMKYKNYEITRKKNSNTWVNILIDGVNKASAMNLESAYQYIYMQEKKLGCEKILSAEDFS